MLHPWELTDSAKDAFTFYHLVHEHRHEGSTAIIGPALPALGHALAGSIATASAKALLYPLDLIITRLQVQRQLGAREKGTVDHNDPIEYAGPVDTARQIYASEGGLKAFYTGCAPDLGKGIADSFLFFLSYDYLRSRQLNSTNKKQLSVAREMVIGILAGSFSKAVTTPIQNIVTRQQTAALVAARHVAPSSESRLSVKQVAQEIRTERGLLGFWNGYSASVVLTLNPAITFAVDNMLRRLLPRSMRQRPGPQLTFLIAAISKAIATMITYPAMLAKSRSQAASPSNSQPFRKPSLGSSTTETPATASSTALQSLKLLFQQQYALASSLKGIYQREGWEGLYSGLEAEVLKGFLQHGLTMMGKEKAHFGVIQAYYLLLRLTKRWDGELRKTREQAESAMKHTRERLGSLADGVQNLAQEVGDRAGTLREEVQGRAGDVGQGLQQSAAAATTAARSNLDQARSTMIGRGEKS